MKEGALLPADLSELSRFTEEYMKVGGKWWSGIGGLRVEEGGVGLIKCIIFMH